MDLIYRVLGIVAKTTQRISRIRGNGIPVNWLLLLLMGIFVAISIGAIREGRQNATGPRACTVSDIATHRIEPGAYVLVTGKPVLDMALADADEKNPDTIWLPYVDGNPLHAIYVEVSKGKSKGAFHNGQCTGMVRPMPKELQRTVTVDGGRVGTAALDTANMLVVGETPDPQWIGFAAAGTLSLAMLAMLVVMLKRYLIFRPISLAPWEQIAAPQNFAAPVGLVRASGRFQFNEKIRRRFIEVSAVLAEMESGDFSLLANVDASEKLYGQVTKNLAGVWAILMRRGSCADSQQGWLYFGRKRRPAIRFRCADAITGQPTTVIVTADETATLNHFRNQVEAAPNAAERQPSAASPV